MRDYTYKGTPTRQVPREHIVNCLDAGIEITDSDGAAGSVQELEECVMERLRIELVIRAILGETH